MNKEQIIKRMNPEQLAKLNGPKTEVADKGVCLDLNEQPMEVCFEETIPEDYSWGNINDLTEHEVHLDVNGKVIDTKEVKPLSATNHNQKLHVPTKSKKKKHRR